MRTHLPLLVLRRAVSRVPGAVGLALALTAPAVFAAADVLVVDPANGPGAQHTSLEAAIAAAASGDVLLLRSGTCVGSFSTGVKSLSFVADLNAQVSSASCRAMGSRTSSW